jgi:Curli assembly protein CsgE
MNTNFSYFVKNSSHASLLVLASIFCMSTYASDIEINGLLTNRTITWFGQDFFSQFASEWRNGGFRGSQNLVVEEVPSARKGTQIVMRYNRDIVFQTSISGTRNQSRERGALAVSYVLARVQRIENSATLYIHKDLGNDEL